MEVRRGSKLQQLLLLLRVSGGLIPPDDRLYLCGSEDIELDRSLDRSLDLKGSCSTLRIIELRNHFKKIN